MRHYLLIGGENTVHEFVMRLNCMNDFLLYVPSIEQNDNKFNQCHLLGDDQLCGIINLAKKPEWKPMLTHMTLFFTIY
jgi:hypothetical protein